jgi:hypothetical protein
MNKVTITITDDPEANSFHMKVDGPTGWAGMLGILERARLIVIQRLQQETERPLKSETARPHKKAL